VICLQCFDLEMCIAHRHIVSKVTVAVFSTSHVCENMLHSNVRLVTSPQPMSKHQQDSYKEDSLC